MTISQTRCENIYALKWETFATIQVTRGFFERINLNYSDQVDVVVERTDLETKIKKLQLA